MGDGDGDRNTVPRHEHFHVSSPHDLLDPAHRVTAEQSASESGRDTGPYNNGSLPESCGMTGMTGGLIHQGLLCHHTPRDACSAPGIRRSRFSKLPCTDAGRVSTSSLAFAQRFSHSSSGTSSGRGSRCNGFGSSRLNRTLVTCRDAATISATCYML